MSESESPSFLLSGPNSTGDDINNISENAKSLASDKSRSSSSEQLSKNSSSRSSSGKSRAPPPPVPVKPPRVYALAKKALKSSSNSDNESEKSAIVKVLQNKSKSQEELSSPCIFENIFVNKTESIVSLDNSVFKNGVDDHDEDHDAGNHNERFVTLADYYNGPASAPTLSNTSEYQMKSVEIYIGDIENDNGEDNNDDDDDGGRVDVVVNNSLDDDDDDNMIPLIIDDYLPFRSNKSPSLNNNLVGNNNDNDETCVTGCSWELDDDDDDGTDCSTSSSCSGMVGRVNRKQQDGCLAAPTQRTQVGCSTTTTCVDNHIIKDQIVVVKLAAKVVQCPNTPPQVSLSGSSPRPPPPPPPVPTYPDSSAEPSCASNVSEGKGKNLQQRKEDSDKKHLHNNNLHHHQQQQQSVSVSYNGDDEDPGKDGNEPGVEEQSSTSEMYQNMVVAHGLMIEREQQENNSLKLGIKVEKKVEPVGVVGLPARPLTVGKGVEELTTAEEEDDEYDGDNNARPYQNVVVKEGKFAVSTKKRNMRSSIEISDRNLPFSSLIEGLGNHHGPLPRFMELNSTGIGGMMTEPSSDVSVPVVHAIINLPPRRANQIKERRRSRFENMSYQKASIINQRMVADFKAAGNDRPSSLSMIRDGKVMSVTSNNCTDLGNGEGNEPGSIIGKVKIGFGLNKAKTSLQKSKSVVSSHVERARRKVGSWYQRRVKTPVENLGVELRSRGSHTDISSIGGGGARDRSRSQGRSVRSMTSTPAQFLEEEEQEDDDRGVVGELELQSSVDEHDTDGPNYSNVLFGGRRVNSTELNLDSHVGDVMEGYAAAAGGDKHSDDEDSFKTKGQNEFEELRRVVKQGGDFCKDLASVLQERSELEAQYAKGLSKLSAKLLKASKEATGSVAHAWQAVAVQIDTQAELHRQWSTALAEEVARPLRSSLETQHKIRKSVEVLVEKTTRNLAEWRTAESKAKRQCFSSSKEFEKLQESSAVIVNNNLNSVQSIASGGASNNNNPGGGGGAGGSSSNSNSNSSSNNLGSNLALAEVRTRSRLLSVPPMEKDPIKLEAKRRKAEEAVRRADIEYYTFCVRSERARLEWESAIRNGSTCLRTLEEEKLSLLRDLAVKYYQYLNELAPRQVQSVESLEEPVKNCSVSQDMHAIVDIRRHAGAEQLLPDFYAEDTSNLMKRERRQEALQKFLYLVNQDLEREKKGAVGIETLAKAIAEAPKIDTAHHDISDKLYYVKSMLLYLEGTRCKVDNALADIEGRQRINNPITQYMRHQRDKQGFPQTILKVPSWAKDECLAFCSGRGGSAGSSSPDWNDRGNADGTSGQHETDFDEFSSQDSGCDHNTDSCGEESNNNNNNSNKAPSSNLIGTPSIGRCRAIYDYDANLFDELTIRTGDVINIHDKQEDGWWLGELNGIIGIFPATYVEEVSIAESTHSGE